MSSISILLLLGWVGLLFFSYLGAELFSRYLAEKPPGE